MTFLAKASVSTKMALSLLHTVPCVEMHAWWKKKFNSVGTASRDRWKDLVESDFYYRREVHFGYDDYETTEEAYTRLKSLKKDFFKINIQVHEKMETLFELERTFGLIPIGDASFLQVVPQKRRMWFCMNGHWMNTL